MRSSQGIHPGEILQEEFMKPAGHDVAFVARRLSVPENEVRDILLRHGRICARLSLRLARLYRTSDAFWLHLQVAWDLDQARYEEAAIEGGGDGCPLAQARAPDCSRDLAA